MYDNTELRCWNFYNGSQWKILKNEEITIPSMKNRKPFGILFRSLTSGGSRISRRGGVDLVVGGVDSRGGYVS